MREENLFPLQFEVEYTFASGGHNTLKFTDGKLFFFSEADSHLSEKNEYITKVSIPKKDQWEDFWENMNKIGVWEWGTDYFPEEDSPDNVDIWQVKIKHGMKFIDSKGWQVGPQSMDEFLIAVCNLSGLYINQPYHILSDKLAEY